MQNLTLSEVVLLRGINCSKHYEWVKTSSLRNSKEEKVLQAFHLKWLSRYFKEEALKNWKHKSHTI